MGVFILVKCGIGFESRNHLIAGLTMSCCVMRAPRHTTYECPAAPRHQRGRGNQPLPPLKQPPNGGFFDFTRLLMIQRKHVKKRRILSVFERPRFTRERPIRIYRGGFGLVNLYFFLLVCNNPKLYKSLMLF